MKKRWISVVLLASMLTTFAAGCGSDAGDSNDTTTSGGSTASDTTTAEETTSGKVIDVPDVQNEDYGGRDFNILYMTNNSYRAHDLYFFADAEDTGDVLSNAIYERNSAVEEALNIKIKGLGVDFDDIYKELKKVASAGDDVYDLTLTHTFSYLTSIISDGLLYDWNQIPNVDMTKNYWNQNMDKTLAIDGVLPVAKSDYMPPEVYTVTFNKKIHDDYQLEDYYQLVRDGKWTLDKFISEVGKVSEDVNGDGTFDANDKYGLGTILDANFQAFLNSCGMFAVTKDGDSLTVTPPSEKLVGMVDKLYNMLYTGHSAYYYTYADKNTSKELSFSKGRTLFSLENINDIELLRNMDDDFGLLPYPKYDEEQEDYYSLGMSGYIAVPISAGDIDLTGKAAELLSYQSAKIFLPVFYDTLLGNKYIRDDESAEMLNIMFDGMVFDYAMVYGGWNQISYGVYLMLANKTNDVMSYYEKNTKSVQSTYDKMAKVFAKYNDR